MQPHLEGCTASFLHIAASHSEFFQASRDEDGIGTIQSVSRVCLLAAVEREDGAGRWGGGGADPSPPAELLLRVSQQASLRLLPRKATRARRPEEVTSCSAIGLVCV